MGWQQKFDKVHDYLALRLGGSDGPMITWPDRGQGGKWTWCWQDPIGETRDISQWVGDGDQIKLYAVIYKDPNGGSGDHQCDMDTQYNGEQKQRWEFDRDEGHDVGR